MSRWSDQFEGHAIHSTLQQARDWLNVSLGKIDGDHIAERRRLFKALELISGVIAGADPEFFPEQLFTQLNGHLRHQNFWNQLQSYASAPNAQNLVVANDHLNGQIALIYQVSKLSRQPDVRKAIRSIEDSYDSFFKLVKEREEKFESQLAENTQDLNALDLQADRLEQGFKTLKSSLDATVSDWQNEFTAAQTMRAEAYSAAQIERGEKFDEAVRDWRSKVDKETSSISAKYGDMLQSTLERFSADADRRMVDIVEKHKAILEIHGLVGTDGVAGGYQKNAKDEHDAADLWRLVAMASLALTSGWILIKYLLGFDSAPTGGINWAEVITASSLTLVLLAAAGYASRQSKLHRETEQQMRWFALEVKAIDPFISSLDDSDRKELKKQLSERLFGQNRAAAGKSDASFDVSAYSAMSDSIFSRVIELFKSIGK